MEGGGSASSTEMHQHNAGLAPDTETELSQTKCCGCLSVWFEKGGSKKQLTQQIFYFCFSS